MKHILHREPVVLDRGYTCLANRLEEAIIHADFTATQLKAVRCIVRFSYGARRRSAPISLARLAAACRRQYNRGFRKQISELVENRVLFRVSEARGRSAAAYSLNRCFGDWGRFSVSHWRLEEAFQQPPLRRRSSMEARRVVDQKLLAVVHDGRDIRRVEQSKV